MDNQKFYAKVKPLMMLLAHSKLLVMEEGKQIHHSRADIFTTGNVKKMRFG